MPWRSWTVVQCHTPGRISRMPHIIPADRPVGTGPPAGATMPAQPMRSRPLEPVEIACPQCGLIAELWRPRGSPPPQAVLVPEPGGGGARHAARASA